MGTTVSYLRGTVGPSGYSSNSTAEDVTANLDLSSKTIIVTGATSGIGKESARVLAKRGAHVILAVRNVKVGEAVCTEILKETPTARLDAMHLDLNSLISVREFAANFRARNLPLHILLNNAGLLNLKFQLSEDGIEHTFATNHLGHFLLTNLLVDIMKATAKECGEEGRIVNVSSLAHTMTYRNHNLEEINNPKRYVGYQAYGQSKLANILHAKELAHRLQEESANVTANALHPGTMDTNFGKNNALFKYGVGIFFTIGSKLLKTIPQAAATSLYVATNPNLNGISGKYFSDCNEYTPELAAASDMELATRYWKFSEELIASKSSGQVTS
ncbi:short-chain dehydrogenase TIC 32 B, chloroplastic [Physcomitrium patens]|uniref:Uncharacterized protein n=1 Tax=Physcomitrium patens TaxID=3218 RepID=A0A2K1IED3_PHYPA|nr:short-chain dehydrogenase TIC 32, chloroplastic-like [Physcomitrium patens]PNR27630.1 hypothetical protein PHYPA_029782 [Physcomitrium patens]|eukprot:XP_024364993.1 short-chain dehydrogenase TIC 32, chloroplastic-like [Physcomitrella patens]